MNTACLLTQPQQKLQPNYNTTITQNHQKIELYGSPTAKELKKSYSFRLVAWADMKTWKCRMGWSHTHVWWIKTRRDILEAREPSPTPDHPDQGFSARKISPHNFWL